MFFLNASTGILSGIGSDLIIGIVSSIATLVAGYIIIRERILKNELRLENVYDYIDAKNNLIDNKVESIKNEVVSLKELSKEQGKTLNESVSTIKEVKAVLDIVKENLLKN